MKKEKLKSFYDAIKNEFIFVLMGYFAFIYPFLKLTKVVEF
jgi:hypothetical protein